MSRAWSIPATSTLLCEGCGYTLDGIPGGGNCPECGRPIADSRPDLRHGPAWEDSQGLRIDGAWLTTSAKALFLPTRFFRTLSVPGRPRSSRLFRLTHHALAAVLLGVAAWVHASRFGLLGGWVDVPAQSRFALPVFVTVTLFFVWLVTLLVVRLTAWEAGYRGLRLPRPVVQRAMDYHAVHLLPAALVGVLTVAGYAALAGRDPTLAADMAMPYIYALAGEVIVAAVYLFKTYWAAMRNLMYANPTEASVEGGASRVERA